MASLGLITDKDVENLEKIKQVLKEVKEILQEIKELDSCFKLSNVIQIEENDTLVFNYSGMLRKKDIDFIQQELEKRFGHKCIILDENITLDKVVGIDYAKGRDYVTETFYCDGNIIQEKTTQFK